MLQISCPSLDTLVDVGWYPEFNPRGRFRIYVIQHENWDQPLEKARPRICRSYSTRWPPSLNDMRCKNLFTIRRAS